jgi:hypothetical protein
MVYLLVSLPQLGTHFWYTTILTTCPQFTSDLDLKHKTYL